MRLDPAGISLPNRRRRVLRTRLLLAGASGLAVLLSTGCGTSGTAGSGSSSTIKIAAVPGIDDAPIYLAQHNGTFAAAGLNVQIKSYPNDAAELSALQQGQVDIAASDYGTIFAAQEQRTTDDLRILADGYDATPGVLAVLTMPGSSIKTPIDLEGQRVGVPSYDTLSGTKPAGHPISLESAAASQALFSYLAANSNTVTWVPMSQPAELSALQHRQLKAILVSEPYVYQAESQFGAVEVLDAASGSTANLPMTGYVATEAWVKSHRAAVAAFKSALVHAQSQAAMAGPIQQTLQTSVGLSREEAAMVTIGTFPTFTNASNLDRVTRLMFEANLLKSPPNVVRMIVR
ncbi:MAG: ABC transporter substrate-binding protein [Streptosporangiaceae bacterium]